MSRPVITITGLFLKKSFILSYSEFAESKGNQKGLTFFAVIMWKDSIQFSKMKLLERKSLEFCVNFVKEILKCHNVPDFDITHLKWPTENDCNDHCKKEFKQLVALQQGYFFEKKGPNKILWTKTCYMLHIYIVIVYTYLR